MSAWHDPRGRLITRPDGTFLRRLPVALEELQEVRRPLRGMRTWVCKECLGTAPEKVYAWVSEAGDSTTGPSWYAPHRCPDWGGPL